MRHLLGLLLLGVVGWASAAPVDLEHYLKRDEFGQVRLSPDGRLLAVTVPFEDRTGLVAIRRSDMTVTANFWFIADQRGAFPGCAYP